MTTVDRVFREAMELTGQERAELALRISATVPDVETDDDEPCGTLHSPLLCWPFPRGRLAQLVRALR